MSKAIDNLQAAMQRAETIRPKIGGFPYSPKLFGGPESRETCGICPLARVST